MDVTARTWTGYLWRVAIIAAMCLGFGGWCLYDGFVGYPSKNRIADAWEQFSGGQLDQWWEPIASQEVWPKDPRAMIEAYHELDASGQATQWPQIAAKEGWLEDPMALIAAYEEEGDTYRNDHWRELALKNGWPEDPADVPHRKTSLDILTQFIMLGITAPIGLIFLYAFVRSFNRWIQCTDTQLLTSSGQRVPIETITRLNKQRWHKGIAVVHFSYGSEERRLVLDDWKFDRAAIDIMVKFLEQQLPGDRVDQTEGAEAAATAAEAGEAGENQ